MTNEAQIGIIPSPTLICAKGYLIDNIIANNIVLYILSPGPGVNMLHYL